MTWPRRMPPSRRRCCARISSSTATSSWRRVLPGRARRCSSSRPSRTTRPLRSSLRRPTARAGHTGRGPRRGRPGARALGRRAHRGNQQSEPAQPRCRSRDEPAAAAARAPGRDRRRRIGHRDACRRSGARGRRRRCDPRWRGADARQRSRADRGRAARARLAVPRRPRRWYAPGRTSVPCAWRYAYTREFRRHRRTSPRPPAVVGIVVRSRSRPSAVW